MEPRECMRTIRATRSDVQGIVMQSTTRVVLALVAAAVVVAVQGLGLERCCLGAGQTTSTWIPGRCGVIPVLGVHLPRWQGSAGAW